MRHALFCVLLLGMVAATGAAGAANPAFSWEDLVHGRIDWGQPPWPVDELAYPAQILPHAAGWFHLIGTGEDYYTPLVAGNGQVLVQDGAELLALRLEDGAEVWRRPVEQSSYDRFAAGTGVFYRNIGKYGKPAQLVALSVEDGHELWRQPGLQLLGTAPNGVWAALHYSAKREVYSSLRLLAADSGKVLQAFALPRDYSPPGPVYDKVTDKWPVVAQKSVTVVYSDGRLVKLPRLHPGWDAYLGLDEAALLLCEMPPFELSSSDSPAGTAIPTTPVVSCYSLPGGELRWQRDDLPRSSPQYGAPFYAVQSGMVVLPGYAELKVVDLRDGSDKYRWSVAQEPGVYLGSAKVLTTPQGAIFLRGNKDRESVWYRLDLAASRIPAIAPQFNDTVDPQFAVGEWLVCNAGHFQWGGGPHTSALLTLRLGPDGLPVAGQLDFGAAQPDYSALQERFLASPAPLADDALMRDLAAQGINAVLALLPAVPPDNAAHLDALLAESIHLYHMDVLRRGQAEPLRLFFLTLKRHARPAYAPTLLRWLRLPELNWLPEEARLALTYCGGPEARDYLCALYDESEVKLHIAPPAPYQLAKPNPQARTFDAEKQQAIIQAGLWAQVEASGGHYAVFPAPGLQNERDLYAASDTDGDGGWDWVLPTGLQDVFYEYHGRGMYSFYHTPPPPGTLELGCLGNTLRISHNRPRPGQENPPPEGAGFEVEFVADKVPLADILRDGDGDGLTDNVEAQLLTDPHNADTDGDGIRDAQDPAPNADPARMDAVARGIARAMVFFYNDRFPADIWWDPAYTDGPYASGQPWQARYFVVDGCGSVAFSWAPTVYGVCISSREQWQQYRQGASGLDNGSLVGVNWVVHDKATGKYQAASSYSIRYAMGSDTASTEVSADDGEEMFHGYTNADMIVAFDNLTGGDSVQLVNVDGEYIPIGHAYNWVVD